MPLAFFILKFILKGPFYHIQAQFKCIKREVLPKYFTPYGQTHDTRLGASKSIFNQLEKYRENIRLLEYTFQMHVNYKKTT